MPTIMDDILRRQARVQVRRRGTWKRLWLPRWETVANGEIQSVTRDFDGIVTQISARPGERIDVRTYL